MYVVCSKHCHEVLLWVPQGVFLAIQGQKGTGPTVGLVLASCGWLVYAQVSEVCYLGAVLGFGISGVSLL